MLKHLFAVLLFVALPRAHKFYVDPVNGSDVGDGSAAIPGGPSRRSSRQTSSRRGTGSRCPTSPAAPRHRQRGRAGQGGRHAVAAQRLSRRVTIRERLQRAADHRRRPTGARAAAAEPAGGVGSELGLRGLSISPSHAPPLNQIDGRQRP